jgi:pimeloyl-ACP methyl ester carboxylesterase
MNQFQGLTMPFLSFYGPTSDRSLEANQNVMEVSVDASKNLMKIQKIAAVKVDVIAHSMGGVLARIYAEGGEKWDGHRQYLRDDNFNQGDINKLITIDTPHSGSFLADAALERLANLPPFFRDRLIRRFEEMGDPLTHGAVEDLTTYSNVLSAMRKSAASAPSSTIIGDYIVPFGQMIFIGNLDLKEAHLLLYILGHDTSPDIIQGHSDLVVSVASQAGGLTGSASQSFGHDHYGIGTNDVFTRLVKLLNAPDGDPTFAVGGFPVEK